MGTTRNTQEKKRTVPAKEVMSPEEKQMLKQVNEYELTTKFVVGNTKPFVTNWKKLTRGKYILDIVTKGLRLDFEEYLKNRQYQFIALQIDELNLV